MDTQKIVRESRMVMIAALVIGLALLGTGVVMGLMDWQSSNGKALVGLSFVPLAVAGVYYIKIRKITRSPQQMRSSIINENDERLVAQRNEADAKAFKIVQAALFLTYMGYTLMVPEDIFVAVGWWILLGLLFTAFIAQGILMQRVMSKNNPR